jgi:hypothetical protein
MKGVVLDARGLASLTFPSLMATDIDQTADI